MQMHTRPMDRIPEQDPIVQDQHGALGSDMKPIPLTLESLECFPSSVSLSMQGKFYSTELRRRSEKSVRGANDQCGVQLLDLLQLPKFP